MMSGKEKPLSGAKVARGWGARALARALGWKTERWGPLPWLRLCAFPALLLASLAGLWGALEWKIHTSEQEARRAAIEHAQAVAVGYEQYLSRTIRQIDQMTRFVAIEYKEEGAGVDVRRLMTALVAPAAPSLVSLADASGRVFSSSKEGFKPISIADRPHFLAIKNNPEQDTLFIGEPVIGRVSGQATAQATRRLADAQGNFAGVVVVSIDPRSFTSFYSRDSLGERGLLAVAGLDGHYRGVRHGDAFKPNGDEIHPERLQELSGVRLTAPREFTGGEERFVAWRRIDGYPLVAIAGLSVREEMADFFAMKKISERFGAGVSALLLVFGGLGFWLHLRTEARRCAVDQTKEAYRAASEGTLDGFFIFRPRRGAGGRVADFELTDVNERGAAMLGFDREKMLGGRVGNLFPTQMAADFGRIYARVWEQGSCWRDGEVFSQEPGALCQRWISHQAARAGGGVAVTIRDITEAKEHGERLQWAAEHDAVTKLPNRHGLGPRLKEAIAEASLLGEKVALLFIDLDNFKQINDTLGHGAGDKLLRVVGERLGTLCGGDGWVCRLGGDEFTLAMRGDISATQMEDMARRAIALISQPMDLGGTLGRVGASVGISVYPEDGQSAEELLKAADLAMYCAKDAGKGTVAKFEPDMAQRIQNRADLERELRQAIERDELYLAYQPKVDLKTGLVKGMEALLRWQSPGRGLVPPLEFIEFAEQTGLILPIGEMVIRKACEQIAAWAAEGVKPLPISVNVSARQLQRGDLPRVIERALAEHKVPRGLLQIELTESCVMENPDFAQAQLSRIKALGAKILVDDFGTGYSSLALLKKLEVDVLKMDRSFIKDLPDDSGDREIVRAIVSMARALNLEVVAEGVETVEQSDFLRELGCGEGQGYYFGRPVKASELGELGDALPRAAKARVQEAEAA